LIASADALRSRTDRPKESIAVGYQVLAREST